MPVVDLQPTSRTRQPRKARTARGGSLALAWLLVGGTVTATLAVATAPASAQVAGPGAAAGWLQGELTRGGGAMPGLTPGVPDVGLTEDVVIALTAAGQGQTPAARAATAAVAAHVADFVSYDSLGQRFAGVRLAGPLAKSLLAAEVQGADRHAFGGWDLEGTLRALMVPAGPQAGRFVDKNPYAPDASNGFGEAFALLALQRTTAGVPGPATGYLLAQQCPAGGFRLFYDSAATCASDAQADTDATGLAVQALQAVAQTPAVSAAQARAVAWLLSQQDAGTGSFSGTGPTAAPNTNTTGVIVPALRAAGTAPAAAAADKAAGYVAALQLGSGPDAGALAYDRGAFLAVTGGSIAGLARDQWRRATAQAVFALGLPGLGRIRAVPAAGGPGGAPGGTSAARVSATTVAAGGSLRVTASGFEPGERVRIWWHSTPVLVGSAVASAAGAVAAVVVAPARTAAGPHHLVLVGAVSGHMASAAVTVTAAAAGPAPAAAGSSLSATGSGGVGASALAALTLLVAGAVLVLAARGVPSPRRGRR